MEEIHNIGKSTNLQFPIQQIHSYESNVSRLVNGKVQYKSPVQSIKGKINQLMIKVTLSKNFDHKQFKIISSISPDNWIKTQRDLMYKLCQDKKMYDEYFDQFYKNHLAIANWCQLAIRQRDEIQPYVFKQLLLHKKNEFALLQNFNNEKVKSSINIIKKKTVVVEKGSFIANNKSKLPNKQYKESYQSDDQYQQQNDSNIYGCQSENASFMKPTFTAFNKPVYGQKHKEMKKPQPLSQNKHQIINVFLNNAVQINKKQCKRKPLNLQRFKNVKKQHHDHHQLYMKTFDACNGWNYIFYDYEKHMKGFTEKKKYNKFVRNMSGQIKATEFVPQKNRSSMFNNETSSKKMQKFKQFEDFKAETQKSKQKCSLLPINMVLNEKQLNNYQGLKKIVNEMKSNKVVFVNHQGKPITYYIKNQETKGKYRIGEAQNKKMMRQSTCNSDVKNQNLSVGNSSTLR